MPRRSSTPPTSGAAGQGSRPRAGSPIAVATITSPGATLVPGARHLRAKGRLIVAHPYLACSASRRIAECYLSHPEQWRLADTRGHTLLLPDSSTSPGLVRNQGSPCGPAARRGIARIGLRVPP